MMRTIMRMIARYPALEVALDKETNIRQRHVVTCIHGRKRNTFPHLTVNFDLYIRNSQHIYSRLKAVWFNSYCVDRETHKQTHTRTHTHPDRLLCLHH